MLNLIHARTFLAVIETRGVRSAARKLDLAASTVADHIKQLEQDLAAPLIERRAGRTAPTAQGMRLLPIAHALVSTAEKIRDLVHQTSLLRISASSNVGIYMLQRPLAAFQAATGCEVDIWIGPNTSVLNRLERGQADVAAMEWWDDRKGFATTTWIREPLVLIVAPDHPWATRRSVSLEELATEPLLGGEAGTGTGRLLREAFGPVTDTFRTVDGFGSTEAVKRAVRAGRGVSIVMKAAVADEIEAAHVVALAVHGYELAKDIKLVIPKSLPPTSPATAFFEAGSQLQQLQDG